VEKSHGRHEDDALALAALPLAPLAHPGDMFDDLHQQLKNWNNGIVKCWDHSGPLFHYSIMPIFHSPTPSFHFPNLT
jgi:hypothetical protein